MKPRWLAWIAGLASLGFGYWLIEEPHTSRELLLAMVAWVLGFWVATGIRHAAPSAARETPEDEEDWEDDED